MKKGILVTIRLLVSLNLLYVDIFLKFAAAPLSVALFTRMSQAVHGLVSEPVFRIGGGLIESIGVVLFLIPRTASWAALVIICFMCGAILSHIFVLGYGLFFVDALVITTLPCICLLLSKERVIQKDIERLLKKVLAEWSEWRILFGPNLVYTSVGTGKWTNSLKMVATCNSRTAKAVAIRESDGCRADGSRLSRACEPNPRLPPQPQTSLALLPADGT
jgi:hypothetical protein